MIPWDQIQVRWIQGESAYSISNSLDGTPTRQAINKKAKKDEWAKLPTVTEKHRTKTLLQLGQDLPENRLKVLDLLSLGSTYRLAAGVIGVSEDTLLRWRKEDPAFAAQCQAMKSQVLAGCAERIVNAKDWKSDKYMLETQKETREDYNSAPKESGRINVVFNIRHSDDVTIKGETLDGEYEVIEDVESDAA